MTACSAAVTSTSSHTPTATVAPASRVATASMSSGSDFTSSGARPAMAPALRSDWSSQPGGLAGHGIVDDGVDLAGAVVDVLRRPQGRAAVLDRGRALVEQLEVVRAPAEGLGQVTLGRGAGGLRGARRSGEREGTKDQESGERNRVGRGAGAVDPRGRVRRRGRSGAFPRPCVCSV